MTNKTRPLPPLLIHYLRICAGSLVAVFAALCTPSVTYAQSDSVEVLKVVDGDTLRVRIRGKNELVRLIGIDAPESVWNERAEKQAHWYSVDPRAVQKLGEHVKAAVSTMVKKGDVIRLEYDPEPRDHYGRILAWVFLSDGTLLNEKLLRLGYAYHLTKPPHYKYAARLAQAARDGKAAQRGLWSTVGGHVQSSESWRKGKQRQPEALLNF